MMRGLVKRRSAAYGLSTLACCLFNNLSIAAPALTTIASFPASGDGAGPQGSLLQIGNIIYGTTQYGGAYGYGSVYSYDLTKKTSAILHSFTGGADGNTPQGGLIALNGTLYGVTSAGGANGLGAVFSVSPTTDVETVVHSFAGSDGSAPMGALLLHGTTLYGTASAGGSKGYGTVFALNPSGGAVTVLHSFAGATADGETPMAGLTAYGNTLYGTTQAGGTNGATHETYSGGTLFRFNLANSKYGVAWNFGSGSDGAVPDAPLLAVGNTLYGTTSAGGTAYAGTLFSFSAKTGAEQVVHSFAGGSDGGGPLGGLAYSNGVLYGTTTFGLYQSGPNAGEVANNGTVFSYAIATQTETVLHSFALNSADANDSEGTPLLEHGLLLGTGAFGGANGEGGVLFDIKLSSGAETILHGFTGSSLSGGGAVAAGTNTLLITSTAGGAAGAGAVLSVDAATGQSSTLASLAGGASGEAIAGPLVRVGSLSQCPPSHASMRKQRRP